jgi:hypothetical protein
MRGAVMRVFVLDKNLQPLDPCHPARARELLNKGRAKAFKRYPFTIVLQDRTVEESVTHPHRVKIDPGSKTTGIAVVQEETGRVTSAIEISNRVSNLCLSCHSCNQAKGNRPVEEFLKKKPGVLKRVLAQAKAPLKDAAAVNATRWELYRRLQSTGLPVEVGSGGRTKFNRKTRGIEKAHAFDAACVGASTPERLLIRGIKPLKIAAKGRGTRQRCRPDKYGFPKAHAPKAKYFQGFQTGDIVKADVQKGKFAGQYIGRIAIRFRPSFVLQLPTQKFDVHPKYLRTIHKADGYEYQS